jgi:glycosyltransferase involved in cell wall biosynthesis
MKIITDGYDLGLKNGTGIATYSKELIKCQKALDHEVSVIFQNDFYTSKIDVSNASSFMQSLYVENEYNRFQRSQKLLRIAFDVSSCILSRKSQKINEIKISDCIDTRQLYQDKPSIFEFLHSKNIFKIARLYASLTNKNLVLDIDKNKFDLIHLTSPLPISIKNTPKLVTVHDLIPLLLPSSTNVNVPLYYSNLKTSLNDANSIIAVSEYTKYDLMKTFPINEERIHVTYQAVTINNAILTESIDELNRFLESNFELQYKNYFLFYGAIEPKKNVKRLIEAKLLSKNNIPLVIIGKLGWLYSEVEKLFNDNKLMKRSNIIRLEYMSYHNLMRMVRGAKAVVFPSLYEGFGLPIVESMCCGTAVITSNTSCTPEIAANAAFLVDPYNEKEISHAMDQFSADIDLVENYSKLGLHRSKFFNHENYQKRLNDVYKSIT